MKSEENSLFTSPVYFGRLDDKQDQKDGRHLSLGILATKLQTAIPFELLANVNSTAEATE